MQRPLRRFVVPLTASLLAVALLAVQWTAGAGASRCEMHQAAAMPAAHHGHHPAPEGQPSHHASCNCLGVCHPSPPGMLPAAATFAGFAVAAAPDVPAPAPARPALPVPTDFLPFALGPPPLA